ncbi:alpha/beta hydrolase [Acuticoccus mangrovi]|uniref:Dienelactone hydrolase family protein n=1 Tax=Acuticoccus mangrovi TaxID=2796142 RepID=A0A934IKQ7_9HYPH|nr:dienelactone hydrolase family protein [Acuticoccus mangrovi]MBJ3775592.1 dienelactone hydrolase family protein [Acuticoccus mangrovi]
MTDSDPHADGRVVAAGAPAADARLGVVMAHGRGSDPFDMLALANHLGARDVAYLALEAGGRSWWPQSFLAPMAANAAGVAGALAAMDRAVGQLLAAGLDETRIAVLGFSQGACLALEFAARRGRPLAFAAGLSGALVGTADAPGDPDPELYGFPDKRFDYPGGLGGMPVYLACHERDPHIPLKRVRTSAAVFEALGAEVTLDVIPGAGHTVVAKEVAALRALLAPPAA